MVEGDVVRQQRRERAERIAKERDAREAAVGAAAAQERRRAAQLVARQAGAQLRAAVRVVRGGQRIAVTQDALLEAVRGRAVHVALPAVGAAAAS